MSLGIALAARSMLVSSDRSARSLKLWSSGYGGTSIDRVAEEAGFSKGAVYSNFGSKQDLFLAVMETESHADLPNLLQQVDRAATVPEVVEVLAEWADARARDGDWALLVLEHIQHARKAKTFGDRQAQLFRAHWKALGDTLCGKMQLDVDAEALGALIFELAFAPAMGFTSGPKSGTLVRLALSGILAGANPRHDTKSNPG
ncbi:TetR/AcrR family transcriptional regulator [Sphingomonas kyeonggiensis]|uniref:AcrR family transcriptional regulator n=1 Tax=Sphingomonas kyeonggiensis TaxID=1268553 RepID=A0A7W6JS73_9SPHN|nr:TetR/AcrR family transcriptional regulator [Sphingomonas kyeonggiensis]MBB4097445.1 AcrR family transcriptional regulator [Sphingomonas kyeonggiensis]